VAVAAVANQVLLILAVPVAVVAETVVHPHQQVQAVHQGKVTQVARLPPAHTQVVVVAVEKALLVLAVVEELLHPNLAVLAVLALNGLMELSTLAVVVAVQNLALEVVEQQVETVAVALAAKVTYNLQLLVLLIEEAAVAALAAVVETQVQEVQV
jgi:hypothetical protein